MLNKISVLSQLSVGMGNIRKQRELIYFYFLQAEKRISFYEFLCNELSFWEDCNLTTVLWAGQFFIIWIFYCSWVIHKVMPTTVSELFWILAKYFGKKHYFRSACSNHKAYIFGQSNLISDWNQVLHWLPLILEDRAEAYLLFQACLWFLQSKLLINY